jgi:endonuclease/exonuclease/phosphatase (EEP) superfamily protein YafD
VIDALIRRARWLLPLLVVALLLPLASPWLHGQGGSWAWLLDLAVHWQGLYAAAWVPVVILVGWRDRRGWMLGLLALLPWWTAAPRLTTADAMADAARFTVVSANVHFDTTSPAALQDWLRQAPADVLVLLEVSPAYAAALAAWPDYPQRVIEAADNPFGIAVLSRHPFAESQVVRDARGIASIAVAIDTPQGCVALRAVHPMPPISPDDKATRDRFLAATAAALAAGGWPSLMAGDFNATPWSSAFAALTATGWQRAAGLAPTWPVAGRGAIGIPIDQVVVSRHWRRIDSGRGPDLGSDHFPLRVVLARAPSAPCSPRANPGR